MDIKWKNYGLWTALGSLVVMAINDGFGIAPGEIEPYVDTALALLTAAGVVSNPEDGKGFNVKQKQNRQRKQRKTAQSK